MSRRLLLILLIVGLLAPLIATSAIVLHRSWQKSHSVEARRDLTISILEEEIRFHPAPSTMRQIDDNLLALLRSVSPADLRTPRIGHVGFVGNPPGLNVRWIADKPDADEVIVIDAQGAVLARLRIPDYMLVEAQRRMSTVGVLYEMVMDFEKDSQTQEKLDRNRLLGASAVLFRGGRRISEPMGIVIPLRND